MKTILFAQSADPTKKSTIVIDGQIYESDSQNDFLQNKFDYLLECDNWERVRKFWIWITHFFREYSPNFQIKSSIGGYYIRSNYITQDIQNRKIMFMFYCESNDLRIVGSELIRISSSIGYELNKDEMKVIM